jgi:hypothetical protein
MPGSALVCPECRASWPEDPGQLATLDRCPSCQRLVQVEVFPAFTRPVARGVAPEAIVVEGEAACFYHPQKRAVVPCGLCGRFLCALCDLVLNGQHLCPSCLETSRRGGKLAELETQRTVWDSAALAVAVLGPALTCGFGSVVTAPAAIGLAVYGWRKPGSIVARTRFRAVLAIGLAVLQLTALALYVVGTFLKS